MSSSASSKRVLIARLLAGAWLVKSMRVAASAISAAPATRDIALHAPCWASSGVMARTQSFCNFLLKIFWSFPIKFPTSTQSSPNLSPPRAAFSSA